MKTELTSLQRAYLLGRSDYVPLGGVAMQEFREYRGHFDLALLERRLKLLAERHDSLRTVIDRKDFSKHVLDTAVVDFVSVDLSGLEQEEADARITELKQDFSHQLFDLASPPWRAVAFQLPESPEPGGDTCAVFFRFDALILDGYSIAALMVELFEDVRLEDKVATSPVPAPDRIKAERDAAYWKTKLAGYEGAPRFPWRGPLETVKTSRYERRSLVVDRDRFKKLSRLGARNGLFRNTALTGLIFQVLSHWLNDGVLHVGIPAAPHAGEAFANRSTFFAVKWEGAAGTDFAENAQALQKDVLEGLDHLSFSGVEINRFLMEQSGADGVALPVVLTNGLSWPILSEDHAIRQEDGLTQTPQVAIDIRLSSGKEGRLLIDIDYAVEAVESEMVGDILAAIDRAVTTVCENDVLDFTCRDILDFDHYKLNALEETYNCAGYLARVADNLFKTGTDKVALVYGNRRVTYEELGRGVHRALTFFDRKNLKKSNVVVLALPRGPEQTMLTLACAFRGIVWVPVDACAPPDRLRFLYDNCKPDLAIGATSIEGHTVVPIETALDEEAAGGPLDLVLPLEDLSASTDAAYYLYTSGTTGKPKCVVLSNRSTDNVVGSTNATWEITSNDVFLSVSPLHHDMSVYEIFGCLTAGATLIQPVEGEEKDAMRWNQLVSEHGVTIWSSVPTIFEMLLSCRQGDALKSLRLINQGGDYLKPAVIAELRQTNPEAQLSSIGGPTETTIWSIWHRVQPEDTGNIPYGRPLPANRYFILNDDGEHCPPGVVGRIHSSGVNTALGYLEDGVLHQHDFVTIKDEHGLPLRAFRSGDRGKYRRDGIILFDSRVQGYIKVRGVRISIPDVENELVKHPEVSRVLLTDLGDERRGETELGALYEPVTGSHLTDADLRGFARQHLQESHVPSRMLRVDSIPLSANGKPDRRTARRLFEETAPDRLRTDQIRPPEPASRRVLDIYLDVVGRAQGKPVTGTTEFLTMGLLPSHLKPISARLSAEFGVTLLPKQLVGCRNADQVHQLVSASRR